MATIKSDNPVLNLSFRFALDIIKYAEKLEENKKYVIAKQVLRSGTSIGANIHEAQSSESKLDFIHKLKIASKEAEETEYWLMLCKYSENYPSNETLLKQIKELQRLLTRIIFSTKRNIRFKH